MFIQNFKGIWDPKETSKLNKNDAAGFRQKSENLRTNDRSSWHWKRLETRWCTLYNTGEYCAWEGDKEYTDQSEWNTC